MSNDDNAEACGQGSATLWLSFAVGSAISAAYIGVRWLAVPLWWHARHGGR